MEYPKDSQKQDNIVVRGVKKVAGGIVWTVALGVMTVSSCLDKLKGGNIE